MVFAGNGYRTPEWHFLDPALIKRVEIVRGPSALLYGSGALGGVISYDTVDAKDLLQEGQSSGFRVFGTGGTGTIAGIRRERVWAN